MKQTPTA